MKKQLIAFAGILLILLCAGSSYAAQPRVVRVGAFNYFPAIFKDSDGVVKGFYIDALADIGRRENIRFEYVYGSWSEGLERIRSGEVDLLTSVAYTPGRASYLDYTDTPVLTVWSELYALPQSKINDIREIEGRQVAVMRGDMNARNFIDLVQKFNISCEFAEFSSFKEIFEAVAAKQVDAGVVNSTFGFAKQKEYGLRSTGVVVDPFDIFFAVSKGQNKDLLELLDRYLKRWQQDANSPLANARDKWAHGGNRTVPRWLVNAVVVLVVLVIATTTFVLLLRRQVRRATADLRANEAKLRSYIDNSPDGVFVTDQSGRCLEVNPAASGITGYPPDELLTMSIPDMVPPGSVEAARNHFEVAQATGASSNEFEFLHKTGAKRWWSVDTVRLSETRYLGFTKDITERKRIEQTQSFLLHRGTSPSGEDFFQSLAHHLSQVLEMDYVCIDELYGEGLMARTVAVFHDGCFEDNVEYALKDTPCGVAAGKSVCIFPREVRALFPHDAVLQEIGAESYAGTTLRSCDGEPIGLIALLGRRPLPDPHLAEAVLGLVAARAAAELERRHAEQERSAIYERFQAIMDSLDALVYVADMESHTLLIVNQYGKTLFGDIEGRICWQVLQSGQTAPCSFCTNDRLLQPDGTPAEAYVWQFRNTVTGKWYQCRARAIRWHDDRLVRLEIATDITELKQAEEDLLQKNAELERFTYTVSHDLKSPLITIQTYAGMIVKDMEAGSHFRAQSDLQRIERAAAKMTALLNDLLELSRIGRQMNAPSQIDMNRLVREVLSQLAGLPDRQNVEIVIDDLPEVHGDPKRIGEVVQNLVENAIKYMGDQASPRIEIGARKQGRECVFVIGDNGRGIPSRFHENIFGLFNKLDPGSDGTGVGLALVKRIVEVHGGRIWVESEGEGRGSRFCFTLERKHEAAGV